MKITEVTPLICNTGTWNYIFVRVRTDEGLVGYGEATNAPEAVAGAVRGLGEYLIGKDPMRIEHLWASMYYMWHEVRGGSVYTSAISGIDVALWDIKGKALSVPVYELLGGVAHRRLRAYRGLGGASTEEMIERARGWVAEGWTAFKFDPLRSAGYYLPDAELRAAVERVGKLREAVGWDVDLMVETHGRMTAANAIRLARELEPFRPLFYEEPVGPENPAAMEVVARSTSIPIATGERLYTKWGFRDLLQRQAAAIVQPDLCHAGGITEVKKIAALAETYDVGVAPHNPFSPLNLAAAVQLDAAVPNFFIQEAGSFAQPGILKNPVQFRAGYFELPTGPGLGVEVDEEFVAAHPYQPVLPRAIRGQSMGRPYLAINEAEG